MKKLLAILLVCSLLFSLTGCEKLDYRKAIDLYNQGKYDAAIDAFYELGDYEDSKELFTLSHYWAAITRMEDGNYKEALPRFLKLGSYEDSAQRAIECQYQMAITEFEAGNYNDARNYFLDVADYKQTPEYLRRLSWQQLFDAVVGAGEEGIHAETSEGMTLQVLSKTGDPQQLTFFVSHAKNMGYVFYDDLALTLTRDSLDAMFTATSTFTMDFNGSQIGAEQIATGVLDISACTADTVLKVDTFQMTGSDNLGNTISSDDPSDMTMSEDMTQNLNDLLTVLPTLLSKAGITVTLQDIGFAS